MLCSSMIFTRAMATTRKLPLIIAHRGASGWLPGHTLPSMDEAIRAGADFVEFDVMPTLDGQLVVNHDITLDHTTNVATLFSNRKSHVIAPCNDDELVELDGYFVHHFSLKEIKELTVHNFFKNRILPEGDVSNLGVINITEQENFKIPTLLEAATFVQNKRDMMRESGLLVAESALNSQGGHWVEFKQEHNATLHNHFIKNNNNEKIASLNISKSGKYSVYYDSNSQSYYQKNNVSGYERKVINMENKWFWKADESPDVGIYVEMKRPLYFRSIGLNLEEKVIEDITNSGFNGPVIIQCFEEETLVRFKQLKPEWKRVRLLHENNTPLDHDEKAQRVLLENISKYADGIGPSKGSLLPDPRSMKKRSKLVDIAHEFNLFVHPYTFKSDHLYLHRVYGGNASIEFLRFFQLGVDGVFADFPDHGVYARCAFEALKDGNHFDVFKLKQ